MIPTQSSRKKLYETLLAIAVVTIIAVVLGFFYKTNQKQEPHCDYPVSTITSYQDPLPDVNEDTLVLFDVDDTLITSPALNPNYFTWWFKVLFILRYPTYIFTNWENAYSLLWTTVPFTLTEPSVIDVIKRFQEKRAIILALTSMESGSYGVIESMPAWRYTMLKDMGITLRDYYEKPEVYKNFPEYRSSYPMLYKNILCANQQDKGQVVRAFLGIFSGATWFSQIIAIDNDLNALNSIGRACEAGLIHYTLVHYAPKKSPDTWNTWHALEEFKDMIDAHSNAAVT
jgi:hypothetical protein